MASIWKKGDHYHCQFLWHGKRRNFPLGAVSEGDAEDTAATVGGLIDRIKQGLISFPASLDVVFVGNRLAALNGEGDVPAVPLPTVATGTLAALRDRYVETHSNGTIEANSLRTAKMHLGHFCKSLGEKYPLDRLTLAKLQAHVNKRDKAGLSPSRSGRRSQASGRRGTGASR